MDDSAADVPNVPIWYSLRLNGTEGTALHKEQKDHLKEKYNVAVRVRMVRSEYFLRSNGDAENIYESSREALELINMNRLRCKMARASTDYTIEDDRKSPLTCVLVCRLRMGRLHTGPPMHGELYPSMPSPQK